MKTMALAGGMLLFILSFASTQIALYILIFSMLLGPEIVVGATAGTTLGRGVTLRVDDFILVIIGFSWLARMALYKELGLFLRTPLNKPIAFYIIACLVSTFLAALLGRMNLKTGFFFVLKYFEYMVVYFMVVNHLQDRKQIRYFLWALLFTCVAVSFIGISQIPGGGRVSAPFEGEAGEPNTFGGYLIFMMAMTIGLVLTANLWRDRLIYGAICVISFVPFLFTQSRGSYLAFFPMLLTFVWLSEKRKLIIICLLFTAILLPLIAPKAVKDRILYTFTQRYHPGQHVYIGDVRLDTSTSARLKSWKDVLKDYVSHPIFGFGVTGYGFVDAQFPRTLVETGIVGILCFISLLWAIFSEGRSVFRQTDDVFHKGICMGFLAGFIGLLVHAIGANTFIIVRIMEPFWFVLGMVVIIPELESKSSFKEPKTEGHL
ncbi:MAG: O-antigen ligase family protein [Deltaproteobacteria bacterium]|nr:O-antigen ligase family protein [Deltaproteobacteria bacterium]